MASEENKSPLKKLLKKDEEPPRWDDGSDDEPVDQERAGGDFCNLAMSVFGGVAGMLGAQFAKYLHQVFACNAYGIPLTSRRVAWYSTPQIAADTIIFFFLYGAILGLGLLFGLGLRSWLLRGLDTEKDLFNKSLAHGFFWLVVSSVILFFLPINIFLIGVP